MKIVGTNNTPYISLNKDLNYLIIEGVSFPEDAEIFYRPLLSELYLHATDYLSRKGKMDIKIKLEYFNTVSAKMIYNILRVFDKLVDEGLSTKVNLIWEYECDDDDLLEAGEDYNCMFSNIFFRFREIYTD